MREPRTVSGVRCYRAIRVGLAQIQEATPRSQHGPPFAGLQTLAPSTAPTIVWWHRRHLWLVNNIDLDSSRWTNLSCCNRTLRRIYRCTQCRQM